MENSHQRHLLKVPLHYFLTALRGMPEDDSNFVCIGGFHVTLSLPCWWTVNKRSLISSFCLSTSICSFHHCYLCLLRLDENHLYVLSQFRSWFEFTFLCFLDKIMHNNELKQRSKIQFEPRIKLHHNI